MNFLKSFANNRGARIFLDLLQEVKMFGFLKKKTKKVDSTKDCKGCSNCSNCAGSSKSAGKTKSSASRTK